MCQHLNEPDSTVSFLTQQLEAAEAKLAQLTKHYEDCVYSGQMQGAELAELEDLLLDDEDLVGEELADCVRELLEIKWMYNDLCQ